ncbi:MAG: hypothetical protein HETSPECPRED_002341 [Heterodermia speciosa]|uniref:Major facilitator superfamily (MFS) profile domain-containing protein n=1 Tax=Heterodermia speciosa TaxID=116794 RepID=A0A8H3IC36_9LECA|nr:MAG: hypothetical protein HETSPECPRED_002341 [Heterodermia speciosa]
MEPDVERSIAHPPPPLNADDVDVDPSLTENASERERDAHSSAPSTLREDASQPQSEKDVESNQAGSSAESVLPSAVKIPRSKRQGLFARFCLLAEVEEPKHYPRRTKWFITFIIALAAAAAPLGSSIILPSLSDIAVDLDTTPTVTNLSIALYMLSMSIFPLWWSSFSEIVGRRTIYLVSFALFLVWNTLAAISTNIAMLVIFRLLGGGAASSVQAVGAGTIADVWEVQERGKAMGIFYLGPLMGPLLAPILGGILGEKLGWRSTQWALVIYGGVLLIVLFFAQPETLKVTRPLLQEPPGETAATPLGLQRTRSAQKIQQGASKTVRSLKCIFLDPLKIILYLRYPAVMITVYYASVTFGCLYMLNISLETTFSKPPYRFNTIELGLAYMPNSLGYIIASLLGGKWTDKIMVNAAKRAKRYDEKGHLIYRPADRMRENAWLAAFLYPSALIWYGWTAEKGIHWVVPLIANFFFGIGSMLIFAAATTMLTEFMPRRASSGVAVNNFVRNIFSCVGAIVAGPLISTIGDGWLFTIMGLWAMASCVVVWAMRHYADRWRARMEKELG